MRSFIVELSANIWYRKRQYDPFSTSINRDGVDGVRTEKIGFKFNKKSAPFVSPSFPRRSSLSSLSLSGSSKGVDWGSKISLYFGDWNRHLSFSYIVGGSVVQCVYVPGSWMKYWRWLWLILKPRDDRVVAIWFMELQSFKSSFFFFFCSDGGGAVNNTEDVSSSFGDFMKNIATEIYRNCKSEP